MYSPFLRGIFTRYRSLGGDSQIILITGPKHSGKSLCSQVLGKITGFEVVDLDELVEEQTGKSPRTLFNEGPEVFRKAEALALASLIQPLQAPLEQEISTQQKVRVQPNGLIIAAGGGLVDNSEAVALLLEFSGISHPKLTTVYLDVSAETAWQRIISDGELPPFLKTENPKETHLALHNRRAESYKALAQISISAENKAPDEIAIEIDKVRTFFIQL
jgi:shikimate kinase